MPMYSLLFFHDPATTEIYTLSLHDALPISAPQASTPRVWLHTARQRLVALVRPAAEPIEPPKAGETSDESALIGAFLSRDRKSTRLNSSHSQISYAVFCLKKKKQKDTDTST